LIQLVPSVNSLRDKRQSVRKETGTLPKTSELLGNRKTRKQALAAADSTSSPRVQQLTPAEKFSFIYKWMKRTISQTWNDFMRARFISMGKEISVGLGIVAATRRYHQDAHQRQYIISLSATAREPVNGGYWIVEQPFGWTKSNGTRVHTGRSVLRIRVIASGHGNFKITSIEEVSRLRHCSPTSDSRFIGRNHGDSRNGPPRRRH
jgi:hypothetical protein